MNFLTEDDIKDILKLNNRKTKALMRTEGFPSIKIGQEYRVEEDDLYNWIKSEKEVKLDYTTL